MAKLPDPMRVDPDSLTSDQLKTHFELLRSRVRSQEAEIVQLKKKPIIRNFIRGFVSVVVSLLMLFCGLLYTYAINKITGTPSDSGAQSLLTLSIWIYALSLILQVINAGGY